MAISVNASLAMWQATGVVTSGHVQLLLILIGVAAVALSVQALMSIGMAIGAMKTQKKVVEVLEDVRAKAMPVLEKSQSLIEELTPHVRQITANVSHISTVARTKVDAFEPTVDAINATVANANRKTHGQIVRVDGMVTSALDATAEIAAIVHNGIRGPLREITGVLSGFKAGLESLLGVTSWARPVPKSATVQPIRPTPAPDAATAAAAEARNEISFAAYREAMQAKRKDLDLS